MVRQPEHYDITRLKVPAGKDRQRAEVLAGDPVYLRIRRIVYLLRSQIRLLLLYLVTDIR